MNRLKTLEGKLLFLVLVIGTALLFTRFALLSFVLNLFIISWFTAGRTRSWFEQTIWVYIYFFCFFTLFIALWSLLDFKLNLTQPLVFLAAAAWIIAIKYPKKTKARLTRGWAAIAAGLAVSIYVCLPIIFHPSSATVLRYSAKTADDASHIARVEAIRSFGELLYRHQAATNDLIDPGTAVSPQAWHANAAFAEGLIIKLSGKDNIFIRLASYLFYKALWLFITVFLLYSFFVQVRNGFKTASGFWYDVVSFLNVSAVSVFMLVAVFGYGFQDFIASIGLICACLIIALRPENTSPRSMSIALLNLLLFTSATFYTWTPAGLIAGLITLAVFLKLLLNKFGAILSSRQIIVLAGLMLLSALPVYELIKSGSQRGLDTINAGGATPPIRILGAVILFLLTSVIVYAVKPKRFVRLLSLLALVSSGFILLAAYQKLTLGETRYYDVKLAFISSVILAVVLLATADRFSGAVIRSKYSGAVAALITIALIPLLLGLDLRKSAWPVKNSAPITDATAKKILRLSDSPNNKTTIIYTSNKGETFLANKLWSSVQLYNNKDRKALLEKLGQQVNE